MIKPTKKAELDLARLAENLSDGQSIVIQNQQEVINFLTRELKELKDLCEETRTDAMDYYILSEHYKNELDKLVKSR